MVTKKPSNKPEEILMNWDIRKSDIYEQTHQNRFLYLPQVFRLKIENSDREVPAQYLFYVETERMGLFGNIENCRKVADKIGALL